MPDLMDLSKQLNTFTKQIPFATAVALTNTARAIEKAQVVAFKRNLDNPTPFTLKSIGSTAARKSNLVARIYVRDIAAQYLEPFEFGGVHKLNSRALLNPKNIKVNQYGNLSRNKMGQLKGKDNVFIGKVGDVGGVWQRVKARKSKKKKRLPRSKNGIRRERKKMPHPKLLIAFGDALPVKPVLGYMERARTMSAALLPTEIEKAISHAMETAK